jgi:3-dehydroquinate synthase
MQTVKVELGKQTYSIHIGPGLLANKALFCDNIQGHQVCIVSNKTVAQWYLAPLKALLADFQCDTLLLPDGEQYKNLAELNSIFDQLITKKHTRKTTLIALGGGVIADMSGFAAACYMRGVNYLQAPTSLLAQVDASIGGKTAVNHLQGKNLIGAFYQPQTVIIDTNTLSTLPEREYREGLAEVIKYGLIYDNNFFAWLETHIEALLAREQPALIHAITRSCQIKATLVAADERETTDIRALLNFGHTFAHAIETGLGYGRWLHGEAVAVGMLLAADLSARMEWLPTSIVIRIQALLVKIGLPVRLPVELSVTQMLTLMDSDKKNVDGRLRLILLKAIGQACVTEAVMQNSVEQLLADYSTEDILH